MTSVVSDFLRHLKNARALSRNTLIAYRRDLTAYVRYVDSTKGAGLWTFADVDRPALRGFLGYLVRRDLGMRLRAQVETRSIVHELAAVLNARNPSYRLAYDRPVNPSELQRHRRLDC